MKKLDWTKAAVFAGLLGLMSGCATFPSVTDLQRYFDAALGKGDLAEAERVCAELEKRKFDMKFGHHELDIAHRAAGKLLEGEKEIGENEFLRLKKTIAELDRIVGDWRVRLEEEDEKVRWTPHAPVKYPRPLRWNRQYPRWLAGMVLDLEKSAAAAKKRYVAKIGEDFARAVGERRWKEAERQIKLMRATGDDVSGMESELARGREIERLTREFTAALAKKDFDGAEAILGQLDGLGAETKDLRRTWAETYLAKTMGDFDKALRRGDFDAAEGLIPLAVRLGGDEAAVRDRLRAARLAKVLDDFDAALRRKDFDAAGKLLTSIGEFGGDRDAAADRLRAARLAKATDDFGAALKREDFAAAEALLPAIEGFGGDRDAAADRLRRGRLAKAEREFGEAMEKRDYARAEQLLREIEALGGNGSAFRERIRQAKIADVRAEIEAKFASEAYEEVEVLFDSLRELGVPEEEIAVYNERLVALMERDGQALVAGQEGEIAGGDLTGEQLTTQQGKVDEFMKKWGFLMDDKHQSAMSEEVRARVWAAWKAPRYNLERLRKTQALRAAGLASWGYTDDGTSVRIEEWYRCTPKDLLEDERYWVDNLRVHLLGYVVGSTENPGNEDIGRGGSYLVEVENDRVEVTATGTLPLPLDMVYVMGTVELVDGRFRRLAEHRRYHPAPEIGGKDAAGRSIPSREDVRFWLNFDYHFAVENLFRRFVCTKGLESIPALTFGEWDSGARTTAGSVEAYWKTH